MKATKWKWYRFETDADDNRPVVFNPSYPWWCSGYSGDGTRSIICAYLPAGKNIKEYWPEAVYIQSESVKKIEFTDRFPRPEYFIEN